MKPAIALALTLSMWMNLSPAIAQEDLRGKLKCERRIDVEKPVWDTSGKRVRVNALSVCVAPDGRLAGLHFIVASGQKTESYPTEAHAPWLRMAFKDGFGKNVWEGNVALASVGTCGGYQTHFLPGPIIDWNKVKVATASLGGAKGDRCGGAKGIEKIGAELLDICKKELGAKDERDCFEKAYKKFGE